MSVGQDTAGRPYVVGAAAGLAAWILGYVLAYLLVGSDVRESRLNQFAQTFGDGDATYELVGWVFFNAHFVDTLIDAGFFGTGTTNFVGGEDGFAALLYLIPPALLIIAGVALARYSGSVDPAEGAVTGALVAPGYLLLSVVGAFLFRIEAGGASGQPDLLPAIVVAGVLYPVVFGAIGGAAAAATADEQSVLS